MILSFLSAQRDQVRERGMKRRQSFMERTLVLVSKPKEMPLTEGTILIVSYLVLKLDIMMMFKNAGFF